MTAVASLIYVRVVVHHALPMQFVKINKVKDIALIILISVFSLSSLYL